MKINQIIVNETSAGATSSGAVATVSSPIGATQSRNPSVYGGNKVGNLLTGKKTNKPYANSLSEGKVKDLSMDLKDMPEKEFKAKYKKSKAEMRDSLKKQPVKKVAEAKLDEEDKIIAPGKGTRLKPGLLNKPEVSINPTDAVKLDVPLLIRLLEFAREDANSDLDLHDLAEKLVARGTRGKTLTMKDYEFVVDEGAAGAIAGGVAGGVITRSPRGAMTGAEIGSNIQNMLTKESGGVIAGGGVGEGIVDTVKRGVKSVKRGLAQEGAKVDRMVKHITKSEEDLGHSKKEAENIAWATANKRGMLDNKNKKK